MASKYREVKDEDIIQYKMMKKILEKVSDDSLREQLATSIDRFVKTNDSQHELLKASQESYEASLKELVSSIKSLTETHQEALQKPSEPQQTLEFPEPVDVQALLEGVAKLIPAPVEAPAPVNVEAIVEKVFNLTNKKPSYTFKIERDFEGRLAGITAIPSEE